MSDSSKPRNGGEAQMDETSQFIQIAVMPGSIGEHGPALFALDASGQVWEYNFSHGVWMNNIGTNRAIKVENEERP